MTTTGIAIITLLILTRLVCFGIIGWMLYDDEIHGRKSKKDDSVFLITALLISLVFADFICVVGLAYPVALYSAKFMRRALLLFGMLIHQTIGIITPGD